MSHRSPTNIASDPALPRPISGSSGDGRPLSVATNQSFHTDAAGTLETESSQPETSPQATPPLPPPRPISFPHLPPGVSGLGWQSTGQNTYDAYTPAPEQYASTSSQPSTIGHMASLAFPQVPRQPPPAPARHPQVDPSGFVGGFAMLNHGASHDTSYRNTADSDPPHYESEDVTGGIHAKVWPTYNRIAKEYDDKMLEKWNSDLDVLLLFAALFSAIVTAFLIRALDDLGPDYQQQSAILLYQILNGRDPNLDPISNPLAPFRASGISVAVNCLWFASLSASLGASFGAMICKEWLTEYRGGTSPVVELIRACRRQIRFMAFQRWRVHTFIALLLPLLHSSVLLFFTGAVVYLWKMDERVAIVYQILGGLFAVIYFLSTFLPFVTSAPFRPYSTLLFHQLSVGIGKVVILIVDVFVHGCYLTVRYLANTALVWLARTVVGDKTFQRLYGQSKIILPGEYKHLRVWWENAFDDSLDEIDSSQRVQEEAILWLSQMPLNPSESKPVVSSLARISSSRPHKFPENVTVFLNLTLESSLREKPSQERTDQEQTDQERTGIAADCILVLGHIKFQSAVDRNSDGDHDVGGVPVTSLVALTAQKLAIDAFQAKSDTPDSEGIRARLLTAAAWLSPVDAEDMEWNEEKLTIRDRFQFTEKIKEMVERHVRRDVLLDNKVLVNLIHGMHACIPRDNYGAPSSIISFLPLFCEDYESPWSEDEVVLRALINYALDLLLPPARRKPLVEREIEFGKLASELIDTLMATTICAEAVVFGFWLIYRVPYTFKFRKTLLADIAYIWTLTKTNDAIPEGLREQMNVRAIYAFVAVAQLHAVATDELPKFTTQSALALVKAALKYDSSRPKATYAMAMILNLGTSRQVDTFMDGIPAGLFSIGGDLEKNSADEDAIDLHICSALILFKYPLVELDVGEVKTLIERMGKAIEDATIGDSRSRWKAIYLSALLFGFVPEGEKRELLEGFKAKVRALLRNGGLSLATDYEHCLRRLDMGALELRTPAEQRGPVYKAFEKWIGGFPLFPLAGSVTNI